MFPSLSNELKSLSNDDLVRTLRTLEQPAEQNESVSETNGLQDLQIYRIELEMQNRALREVQSELEQALVRYTDLYDHLPFGYVTLTPSGQIAQANLTAARWLHRDRAQLAGVYMNWFLDAFDAGRLAAHLDLCLHTTTEHACDVTLRLENGLLITVQLSSRATVITPGAMPQIHTAMTNVSKLKQTRAVIGDIEREESTACPLVAGELGAPYACVSHYVRNLLTEHRSTLSPEVVEVAERMECAALRAEATLQHLVEYCSFGRESVAVDPVNLEEVVQHVIVEHRDAVEQRHAVLDITRPLPCVRGSRLILAQVLANLLINALRYPPRDQPRRVTISAEERPKAVVLKITHDGLKLPAGDQNFRVFERLHGAGHFLSNGIGFAVVRHAIERMGGRVWTESEGNHFFIELRRV